MKKVIAVSLVMLSFGITGLVFAQGFSGHGFGGFGLGFSQIISNRSTEVCSNTLDNGTQVNGLEACFIPTNMVSQNGINEIVRESSVVRNEAYDAAIGTAQVARDLNAV